MNLKYFQPEIICKTNSVISGLHTEAVRFDDALFDIPILEAFVEDEDLYEMTIVSTCIGFVKTFTKQFIPKAEK
jgi:hypothetical protein